MAWRPARFLLEGVLDNTLKNKVSGWMRFAGMKEKVIFDLEGNFHRDIRGAKIRFRGSAVNNNEEAEKYMEDFCQRQLGKVGDMTAGLPPEDYVSGHCYLEWYSNENGRVVIELEQKQVELLTMPISVRESEPISRKQQNQNMTEFLGKIAHAMKIPEENAICIDGKTIIKANNKIGGMKLLTQEIRKKLPPLYAQDGRGGKAIAYLKLFTPDSGFTWWITEGSPIKDKNGNEVDFHFFGLVEGQFKELGYVSLKEIEEVRGPMGLPIERDLHWQPKTLEEIAPEMFK